MARALEHCKYVVLIGVVALMVAAFATFLWGSVKTINFVLMLINNTQDDSLITLYLLQAVDIFLIGTVLLILSTGLYDLFIHKLDLPDWLSIDDLSKLKAKLSDVIILFMAIKFLEKLLTASNPQDILFVALSVAVVAAVLIAFNRVSTEKG